DRTAPYQVAHNNAVRLSFANRNLVDADDLRPGRAEALQLRPHVLHLEVLDRVPVAWPGVADASCPLAHGSDRAAPPVPHPESTRDSTRRRDAGAPGLGHPVGRSSHV